MYKFSFLFALVCLISNFLFAGERQKAKKEENLNRKEGAFIKAGNSHNDKKIKITMHYFMEQPLIAIEANSSPYLSFNISATPKKINKEKYNYLSFSGSYIFSKHKNRQVGFELRGSLNEKDDLNLRRLSLLRNETYCNSKDCLEYFIVSTGIGLTEINEKTKKVMLGGVELGLSSAYKVFSSKYFQWTLETLYSSRYMEQLYLSPKKDSSKWFFNTGPRINLDSVYIDSAITVSLTGESGDKIYFFSGLNASF